MRKTFIALMSLAAAAATLLSCAKEIDFSTSEEGVITSGKGVTINVFAGEDTKTYVEDGEIPTVKWSDTDKVAVFEMVDGSVLGYAISDAAVINGGKASFKTEIPWGADGSSYKYSAVYPQGSVWSGNSKYYVFLPWDQYLDHGNLSDDSDILFSTVVDHGDTRVSNDEGVQFAFRRLGTIVRLTLAGITPGETIRQVTINAPVFITGSIQFDPVTGSVVPESAFDTDANSQIILHLGDVTATGNDVIWFRVMSERDWGESGDGLSFEVITDKNIYRKTIASCPVIKFPDGGLTKFGVDLSSSKVAPQSVPYDEGFESGAAGWSFFDADWDGNEWERASGYAHSGSYALASYSYTNQAINPDNWAFTPALKLTEDNYLSFWVRAAHSDYPYEHYAVYITEEVPLIDRLNTYDLLLPETDYPGGDFVEFDANGYYEHFIIPIPAAYQNKTVYIGFRHFNCTDQYWIRLDDVKVTEGMPALEPVAVTADYDNYLGLWINSNFEITVEQNVPGSSYTISGLPGLGAYTAQASFSNGCMILSEQVLGNDGGTSYVLQSAFIDENDDYQIFNFFQGFPKPIIRFVYDGVGQTLAISTALKHDKYCVSTYDETTFVGSGELKSIPTSDLGKPLSVPYDSYLGQWSSGNKIWTIEPKDDGTSYYLSGFEGQGEYKIEAVYSYGRFVVYEQVVNTSGTTEVVLQGLYSSGGSLYWNAYPEEGERVLFSATYDADDDALEITTSNNYSYYIWLTYNNKNYSSYGSYSHIPASLIPYVPSTASYGDYLGQWSTGSGIITIAPLVADESYSITGLIDQGDYLVQAVFQDHQLLLYDQSVYSEGITEVKFQGITSGYTFYSDPQLLLIASFDGSNKLNISSDMYTMYCFLVYTNGSFSGNSSLVDIPSSLTYYGPLPASAPALSSPSKKLQASQQSMTRNLQPIMIEGTPVRKIK